MTAGVETRFSKPAGMGYAQLYSALERWTREPGNGLSWADALDMIRRFLLSHPTLGWVAGDEVYGGDPELRDWLEEHRIGYVLGIRCDTKVTTAVGRRRVKPSGWRSSRFRSDRNS